MPISSYIYITLIAIIVALGFTTAHYVTAYNNEVNSFSVLDSSYQTLKKQVGIDSERVKKEAEDYAKKEKANKVALDAARARVKDYEKWASLILVSKPTSKDMCQSADVLFNQFLTGKLQ